MAPSAVSRSGFRLDQLQSSDPITDLNLSVFLGVFGAVVIQFQTAERTSWSQPWLHPISSKDDTADSLEGG